MLLLLAGGGHPLQHVGPVGQAAAFAVHHHGRQRCAVVRLDAGDGRGGTQRQDAGAVGAEVEGQVQRRAGVAVQGRQHRGFRLPAAGGFGDGPLQQGRGVGIGQAAGVAGGERRCDAHVARIGRARAGTAAAVLPRPAGAAAATARPTTAADQDHHQRCDQQAGFHGGEGKRGQRALSHQQCVGAQGWSRRCHGAAPGASGAGWLCRNGRDCGRWAFHRRFMAVSSRHRRCSDGPAAPGRSPAARRQPTVADSSKPGASGAARHPSVRTFGPL